MLKTSIKPQTLFLIIIIIIISALCEKTVRAVPVRVNRAAAGNGTLLKDDLTTQFAKQIMRLSKTSDIKAMLNTNIEPCDDFYQYACGNWQRHYPAQLLNNIMTDKFQMIAKAFDRRLEQLLTEYGSSDELERKVRNFYQACQVAKRDDVLYKLELENVYKEYGEMPVLTGDSWQEDDFNWWQVIGKIQRKYGKQIILAVDIMGDIVNNTENRIYVGPPEYSMATTTKVLSLLHEAVAVADMQKYFGVEHALAKKTAKEMIELERALVQGGTDSRLGLNLQQLLSLKKVSDLRETFNESIDMQSYLQLVLGDELPENVYIYDEKYLQNIFKTIDKTPKHVVANYILWQLLQEYLIDAAERDVPHWCIEKTKKYFGKYVDHMVYRRYRNEAAEQEVYKIWEELRETFREELKGDKLDWISNATREYAIEKLNAMTLAINSYENENFTDIYGDLKVDALNHVENVQQVLIQETRKKLQRLLEPAKSLESTEVLSFTPAYSILENNIKIPVALLQPRFFYDNNYPQALKYATLGYLIAHEMVHGFDDEGRNYDKDGNQHSWWDVKSTYEFEARRKCFQAQYHNYKYGGKHLPESLEQAENIADNAGVKLAYAAYIRWLRVQKATDKEIELKEVLPELDLDNRQLFFVNFAQVWCDDVQTLFRSTLASGSDSHAPSMYRVIGSLSNFQEFSWVFQCKPDAPMDPEFKCSIY